MLQARNLIAALLLVAIPHASLAFDFSYHYGDPKTPLDDGYIVSTSNAGLYSEAVVRAWTPNVGGTTFGNTTPGVIVYHFPFAQQTAAISLWMNMPTFHWSYSEGHNFLYGSTNGADWLPLAELLPPAYGAARDLGTVAIPAELVGAADLWLRVELYSYGPSAPQGGVLTNTAQLSRWATNSPNGTSFRLDVDYVPEPATAGLLAGGLCMLAARVRRGRRT